VVKTRLAAGQKRKYHYNSGPRVLSASKEFPRASYRRPAAGQTLGITDQPDELRMVLSCTVRQVIRHAISKSMYIEMTKMHSILCKIFMQTARNLGQNTFVDRMKADGIFQKDVAGMVCSVCCDWFLDLCLHYPYPAEQPPVRLSKQHQEHSQRWDG